MWKAALLYYALVFGAGFVLGPVRVLWLVPSLGERYAELAEMPVMGAVIVLAARLIVRRFRHISSGMQWLGIGGGSLALLILSELGLTLALAPVTITEYISGRDPVSGTVYLAMLTVFAVMPWYVHRGRNG